MQFVVAALAEYEATIEADQVSLPDFTGDKQPLAHITLALVTHGSVQNLLSQLQRNASLRPSSPPLFSVQRDQSVMERGRNYDSLEASNSTLLLVLQSLSLGLGHLCLKT